MSQQTGRIQGTSESTLQNSESVAKQLLEQIRANPDAFAADAESLQAWQAFLDEPDADHPAIVHLRAVARRPQGRDIVETLKRRSPNTARRLG